MTSASIHLMRHAATDWGEVNARRWSGPANDFAPLTPEGRRRAVRALRRFADRDGDAVVAVCHAVLIHAVTGRRSIDHCELVEVGGAGGCPSSAFPR